MQDRERFWLVWCPSGPTMPRVRHTSGSSAISEAKRLAGANPGQQFFVLEAIGSAKTHDPVEWTELDETHVPF